MRVLRWILTVAGAVIGLALLLSIADGTLMRFINMPKRPVIVRPIEPGSELSRLMAQARQASRAQDHAQAIELYTRALAIEPGPNVISQDLHALRGGEYNFLGKAQEAFADYDAAIRVEYYAPLSDQAIRAYMGRGYAAVQLQRYARAKEDFDVVLKALPNDVPRSSATLAWRGAAHQGLGERARAVADYKAALTLDANNAYARTALKDLGEP